METASMPAKGTPTKREFLCWFHQLEDDESRAHVLLSGGHLIQAAMRDDLIAAGDVDGFAHRAIQLINEELLGCEGRVASTWQFGANPSYDLQQLSNFYSTPDGRGWLAEASPAGPTFNIQNSPINQLAGGDINNITIIQALDLVAQQIEQVDAPEEERRAARTTLDSIRRGAAGLATDAGGGVLAIALARAFGLG